jgi:hypothetical protein
MQRFLSLEENLCTTSLIEPNSNFLIPELNGSSDLALTSGVFEFRNSPDGIIVLSFASSAYQVGFYMPGDPAYGGEFDFDIDVSGLNGAPDNSEVIASDGDHYTYETDGTLTLDGQAGAYDLTPEPPSWLLLASGIALLGFMFYRRPAAVAHLS